MNVISLESLAMDYALSLFLQFATCYVLGHYTIKALNAFLARARERGLF